MDNNWFTRVKFIAGGSIVAGTTVLAEQISPKYGGILATAPIITTLAFIFMFTGTGAAATRQLVLNSFYFVIPTRYSSCLPCTCSWDDILSTRVWPGHSVHGSWHCF